LSDLISEIIPEALYKAFFIRERRVRKTSAFSFFKGRKKFRAWKNLSGFRQSPSNFSSRLALENISSYEFCILLGQDKPRLKKDADISWLLSALEFEADVIDISLYRDRFPILADYLNRGLISPFSAQIIKSINQVFDRVEIDDFVINVCLESQLIFVEQLVRRAFILDLNISAIKGDLKGKNESERFQDFASRFHSLHERLAFFLSYPVLFRTLVTKLDLWADSMTEFLTRLNVDKGLLEREFGIAKDARLKKILPSGDTHNHGRSVMVVEFSDGKSVVYKPRSTSLEFGFQEYLKFFNTVNPNLNLRCINVIDKTTYGWVEFVSFFDHKDENESDIYHFKLGFLTGIVFSLNGVDIFFENLISSGPDPVIIDLETMFHTPIDAQNEKSLVKALQLFLFDSISGIGILPSPGRGATDNDLFDVSVMGAKRNSQAPYKVTGIENFGRADMRITEIPGWIHENKSSSENDFLYKRKAQFLFEGLQSGLNSVMQHQQSLAKTGGVVDKCFGDAKRRLLIRDTKAYGTLQQDETHPDLLRNQVDREWHWDNLWSDVLERPSLLLFAESELNQLKQGDIPYFYGDVNSLKITGGDGSVIDLSKTISESPLQKVKSKLLSLSHDIVNDQARIAATTLGLDNLSGITQPMLDPHKSSLENTFVIAKYITSRAKYFQDKPWYDNSYNPVPAAKDFDPVRVGPSDPFLYEGVLGVVMFLHDLWVLTGDKEILENSLSFAEAVFQEIESEHHYSASGFVGLSSVIYVINRCIEKEGSPFSIFEKKLPPLVSKVADIFRDENRLDLLLGTSGIASALLPYVKRTSNKIGISILRESLDRLKEAGDRILKTDKPIDGMDYLRGFSHGISGIALALVRLGEFLKQDDVEQMATDLLLYEYDLVKTGQWTDSHSYNGVPLVGWCHGSAGISLALSSMPKLLLRNKELKEYFDIAISNTLSKGVFDSKCLCHGTAGNLLCVAGHASINAKINNLMKQFEVNLLESGFISTGAAQTMGIGLMTGLTGAGYYLLGRADSRVDYGFLTLS
jgi:type 2 lantibiotic biosynthesis protein LanM